MLDSIQRHIQSINYDFKRPQSYVVFVPILAETVYAIQKNSLSNVYQVERREMIPSVRALHEQGTTSLQQLHFAHCLGAGVRAIVLGYFYFSKKMVFHQILGISAVAHGVLAKVAADQSPQFVVKRRA